MSVMTGRFISHDGMAQGTAGPLPPPAPPLVESLALRLAWAGLTRLTRFPGGAVLFPLVLGAAPRNAKPVDFSLPPWVLQTVCALVGWRIGLGFSRAKLSRLMSRTPAILAAIVLMVANSGLFAVLMVLSDRFDPLTSYLATSPGGLDAVTAMAAGTGARLPFITAMQTPRLLMVMVWGPALARVSSRVSGVARKPEW